MKVMLSSLQRRADLLIKACEGRYQQYPAQLVEMIRIAISAVRKIHFPKKKLFPVILVMVAGILAVIPLYRLIYVIHITSVDTVSNDYLRFTSLAERVLSAGYDWRGYFSDSFDNHVHSYAFLFLVRLGLAQLSHLSIMAEIILGLALAATNLLLQFFLIFRFIGGPPHLKSFLLPLLSALVFSYSQIATYGFGETALQMGFTHFGVLVGLWFILLRKDDSKSPWVMFAGGVVASFSGGAGLLAWPVFMLAILLSDPKGRWKYFAWTIGFGIGIAPYLAFSAYSQVPGSINWFNPDILLKTVTGLGLPMANSINYGVITHRGARNAGLVGLVIFVACGISLLFSRSKPRMAGAIPGLVFVAWGMAGAVQVALSRATLAPWYTSTYILFWIGLTGLCAGLGLSPLERGQAVTGWVSWERLSRMVGWAGLVGIAWIYILTNQTYADKDFYLASRSPASAACLRSYPIAPTFCEGVVYQWGVGNPLSVAQMGSVLAKYNWSVFARHQEWSLQGAQVLGNVDLIQANQHADIQWVRGGNDEPAFWQDYHHLNVILMPGQSLRWVVHLPDGLAKAQFRMGLSLVDPSSCRTQSISIHFEVLSGAQEKDAVKSGLCEYLQNMEISEDIAALAGEQLVIRITNENDDIDGKAVRLHYPQVVIDELPGSKPIMASAEENQPLNTDLSVDFAASTLDTIAAQSTRTGGSPTLKDLGPQEDGAWARTGQNPAVRFGFEQPVCVSSQSRIYFDFGMSQLIPKRMIRLKIRFSDRRVDLFDSTYDFPVLPGEQVHGYYFPLDMISLPPLACVASIEYQFGDHIPYATGQWLRIANVKIIPIFSANLDR